MEESRNSWIHGMPAPRIAWFPPFDKSTLGDTDDDIGFERSAKGCLSTLARRLKLCSEHS